MRVECHLFGACLPRRLRMTRASGAQPRSGHSAQLHFIFPPKYVFIAVVSDFTGAAPASRLIQKSPPRRAMSVGSLGRPRGGGSSTARVHARLVPRSRNSVSENLSKASLRRIPPRVQGYRTKQRAFPRFFIQPFAFRYLWCLWV